MVSVELLARITDRYGPSRIAVLPEVRPEADNSPGFERLRDYPQGAPVVVFPAVSPGRLDGFFHLRLAQLQRREPPAPTLSIVVLTAEERAPKLAAGFSDRFRSGWPFAVGIFVTEADDAAVLSTQLGLPVERADGDWTPLRSQSSAGQKIALQFQSPWGRCGSTTAFENQIESLVHAGYLTIRLFTDAALRRGETLARRLEQIIPENADHVGAHIDALAVPDGPPIPVRARDHDTYWASWLAATATCRVRDAAIVRAMSRADAVIANHLECVGPALHLAPAGRLMLDVHDDRVVSASENMRRAGRPEPEIEVAASAASRAQAAILAIPDICTHVNVSEFSRLKPLSRRAAIVLPRVHAIPWAPPTTRRFDVLIFGDEHPFNIASLRWFLGRVWQPYLADAGVSLAIAGRVGPRVDDIVPASPNLRFLGFVDDLDALRRDCGLTVVTDQYGSGVAVKTLATLAAGHALVCTSVGLRGLDPAVAALLPARDEAAAMAADILALSRDPDRLTERRELVQQASAAIQRGPDYATLLASIPRPTPRERREREARWARIVAAAIPPDPRRYLFEPGVWFPMSGSAWDLQVLLDGWHGAEAWGRWTDGARGCWRLTPARPMEGLALELDLAPPPPGATLSVAVDGDDLGAIRPVAGLNAWDIPPGALLGKTSFVVTATISQTVCPASSGASSDTRILGLGVIRARLIYSDA